MTTTDELEHRKALEALAQRVDALTAVVEHAADRLGTVEVRR